ncbi:hypothetical protein ACHAXS_007040 [Conticribra weissflogii]
MAKFLRIFLLTGTVAGFSPYRSLSSTRSLCLIGTSTRLHQTEEIANHYDSSEPNSTPMTFSRRGILAVGGGAGASALTLGLGTANWPLPASAISETLESPNIVKPSQTASNVIVSNSLCDPSVSTWVKAYTPDENSSSTSSNTSMRTIHILGTAHISSSSAELAGKMVRELKPNVVFVELDAKRVSRAIPGGGASSSTPSERGADAGAGDIGGAAMSTTATNGNEAVAATTSSAANDASSSATITSVPPTPTQTEGDIKPKRFVNPFDIQSKLVNVGSKYVGNAVKGMYGKLESEGFKAGDEFAMSVREGLAIGSTIVLGDRDVEVTLKRLTQALAKTDLRKLLSADSEVEKSMESLLPEGMKKQMVEQQQQQNHPNNLTSMGIDPSMSIDKQEFNTFVETMKAKENVKKIMNALKATAPEIYEAMVAERDVYMARGLDELDVSLGGNGKSVDTTVAVMGMAHVDGVEKYLAEKGWREMRYPCTIGGI